MSGSASVVVYLRRGKSHCRAAAGEGSENMIRKQLCRYQGRWRTKGGRCSRRQSRNSSAARGADHGEASAAQGGAHVGAGGCLEEAVTPWEAHTGTGSWQDLWERSAACRRFVGRTRDPWGPHAGAASSWRTALHGRVTHPGAVHEELQSSEVLPRGRRRGSDNMWLNWVQPPSLSLCTTGREEGREIISKFKPRKKGGVGKVL